MPIPIYTLGHSLEDPLGASLVGEEAHGPGSSSHLPEVPLHYIGGACLLPQLRGERVVVETVV